jgi:hypothetical protein
LLCRLQTKAMSKATVYNNAGVYHFKEGDYKIAWDLFKGALEVKLDMERIEEGSERTSTSLKNPYIMLAEDILQSTKCCANQDLCCSLQRLPQAPSRIPSFSDKSIGIRCDPYVYTRPFQIPEECNQLKPLADRARATNAIIIFNLALMEHIFDRLSEKVMCLYELSSSLLVGEHMDLLGVALVNNIGVWCFENDDMDASQRCMEHLRKTLQFCDLSRVASREYSSIMNNIIWILSPPGAASAAA